MDATYGFVALLAESEIDWGHMDMDGGWWIVMLVGMLLFWALVVVGIVWVVREVAGSSGRTSPAADPLAILDRRFAEGAISAKEYRERRAVLTGNGD